MKKIRFGVIGCGSIANEYHLPALRRVEGAQLVWACDLIEERAQKAKDDFGFEKYTLDYHDILNDSSIDAVCIFTKIEMHATLCIEAAAAGKHIFSQKPFAYNIEEGRKIIRAVDEAGVKLTPSFMHSYMDGSIAARRIVEEGKIGEIRHIRMRNATKNPFDSAPGYGGCMMDIGCHGMDLIHTVAGSSIEEVFALHLSPRDEKRREEFGERANLNGVENTAILNYRLASGATVFHEVFWTQVAQTNRFEMEIYGAKGVIYLYNPHRSDIVYYGWNLDGHPRKDIHWQVAPVDPQFFGYIHHKTFVDDLLNGTNNSKPCAGTGHAGLCLAVRDRAQQEHAAPPDGRRRCRDRGRAGHCGKRDGKWPYAHGVHRAAFGRRRNLAREALAFRGGKNSCRRAGQRL